MRYIDWTISCELGSGDRFDMKQFVRALIDRDGRFNTTGVGVRASIKIEKAIGSGALEDADWELLQQAAEQPTAGYPISPARGCLPFIDGIKSAPTEKP